MTDLDQDLAAASELVAATPDDDKLRQVRELAQELLLAARKVELANEALTKATELYRELEERRLPTQLQSLGLRGLPLDNGAEITLKDFVNASLDKEQLPDALEWLKTHGLGDLIKNVVSVTFGRGEDEAAEAMMVTLTDHGLSPENRKNVHPQSLNAAVRELMERGGQVDTPAIKVFTGTVAKLKLPKNITLRDILGT